jgi:hypothetical protein
VSNSSSGYCDVVVVDDEDDDDDNAVEGCDDVDEEEGDEFEALDDDDDDDDDVLLVSRFIFVPTTSEDCAVDGMPFAGRLDDTFKSVGVVEFSS